MNKSFQIVPWFNTKEWQDVYDMLFASASTDITKRDALNILYIWKARSPFLPSGIESTLSLLEAYLQDLGTETLQNDYLIRLAYSTALMRYVNHMLDTETAKGASLYNAAKSLGVPDWIIELRHDTAHSNKLPPLDLLRQAAAESIQWLQTNYWDVYKNCVSDYVITSENQNSDQDNKIAALLNFCVSLSIYSHSKCNIKNVGQISDTEIRDSLLSDAVDLFGNSIDITLKNIPISTFHNLMNSQAKKLFCYDVSHIVKKVLLSEDSLFLSYEVYDLFHDSTMKNHSLDTSYIQCFQGLLHFLHSYNLLQAFILELINISHTENNNKRCKLAAQWVSVILNALKKCQQFVDKLNESQTGDITSKEENDLKSLYYHWYPNEKINSLLLKLQKPIPQDLTDMNYIRSIVSTYNPYLTFFIRDLLSLCQPSLPKQVISKLCQLADLIAFPEKFPIVSTKIYTVKDVDKGSPIAENSTQQSKEVEINDEAMEVEITSATNESCGTWQLAPDSYAWSTCPIGILPWQLSLNAENSKDSHI